MHASNEPAAPEAAAPAAQMLQMITGYWVSQLVSAFAELRIADLLGDKAMTAEALAECAGAEPDSMTRLLRAGVSAGLLSATRDGRFRATPLVRTLADEPDSLRALALAITAPGHWKPWGQLANAVRTATPQSHATLGADIWQYYDQHADEQALFTQAMSSLTTIVAQEAVRLLDLAQVETVADIGGAAGALLCALLRANPHVRGILFDQPAVTAEATAMAHKSGLADRIEVIGGDFFTAVPPADMLIMKHVLHDWNDTECIRILQSCAAALRPASRLVVIEQRLGEIDDAGFAALMDLNMLVLATGRERTVAEYKHLFEAAGLTLTHVTETNSPYVFIEAMK
jgi:precorrin-6B methylase 2